MFSFIFPVPPGDVNIYAPGSITTNAAGTEDVILFEDSSTSLTCRSVGSLPKARISWFVGPEEDPGTITCTTSVNKADHDLLDTTCTLQLIPKRQHHYQILKCVAYAGINERFAEVTVIVHGEYS